MKCLGHEAMRGHVQYVYRITAVPISLSLVTQAGLLENLHRLDTMIVEKVAKKGRHTITRLGARFVGLRTSLVRAAPWGPWLRRGVPGRSRLHEVGWRSSLMVRTFLKVYMELGSYFFVSARTNKRHHHQGGVAAFKCGIMRWKVGFASGAMTVVIAVGRAARATAESTTSSRSVILAVRHVAAAASKTRKVDAGTTAGEGKSAPVAGITRWASPSARSAQIRGAVSVHQNSLIH
jgi:hypothetical protein